MKILTVLLAAAISHSAVAQDYAIIPNPVLTPGSVRTTDVQEICSNGTKELRHWSRERDDHILAEYGLSAGPHPSYEIDHSIPLGIGGSDEDNNLWPQARASIEPIWSAERKDKLEWRLRELVCSSQLDVREAQRAIQSDWTEAYQRFIGR